MATIMTPHGGLNTQIYTMARKHNPKLLLQKDMTLKAK